MKRLAIIIALFLASAADADQSRYVRYGSQTIDLATFRGCGRMSCGMCAYLRGLKSQYISDSRPRASLPSGRSATSSQPAPEAGFQQATPTELIPRILDLLSLGRDDVLCDFGCGDGRVLIAAAKAHGCRCVGVELDKRLAQRAHDAVREAGLSDLVTIYHGDALTFPMDGITKIYVYQFPEMLSKLRGKLFQADVVVSLAHPIEGVPIVAHGDLFVWRVPDPVWEVVVK